jgi:hypothetical protein
MRQWRCPLDVDYYAEAVLRKLCPVLSALFVEEEKRSLTHQTLGGGAVEVRHTRASERNALDGQTTAEKRLRAALAGRDASATRRRTLANHERVTPAIENYMKYLARHEHAAQGFAVR